LAVYVDDVMRGPGKHTDDGHTWWADEANQMLVIRGPNPAMPGTVYGPDSWVRQLKKLDERTPIG